MKKNIVIIGGGNGSATVINSLKKSVKDYNLTAVVSMSDSGRTAGQLRQEFNTLPPADILRAILAFSPYDYYRFLRPVFFKNRSLADNKLKGFNLGSLFLVLAAEYAKKDYMASITALHDMVEAVGRALPNTLTPADLCVELQNGKIVRTEGAIDRPNYDRNIKISKAWLDPAVTVYSEAAKAIKEADFIVLCPGSLYTSLIAALLPKGQTEAIKGSKAKLIYIAGNAYEAIGETGPTRLTEIVSTLERYLPRPVDVVLCNTHKLTPAQKKHYAEKEWGMLDLNVREFKKGKVITADFESNMGGLSPDKLRAPLLKVITNLSKSLTKSV